MYFASRAQAGRMLATQLVPKYRYEDCAIVALNDGGVVVAAQIAMQLHCVINLLLYEEIKLPMEPQAISGIAHNGAYIYNSYYAPAEAEELVSEYRGFIEQEKTNKMSKMQHMLGHGGVVRRDLLKGHTIILVSDGLRSPFGLELAAEYLKPINYEKLVVVTPLASIEAVDRMHVLADDLYCLNVVESTLETDHYYDQQDVPSHEKIIEIIEKIILNWQ
jgi:predicted phosphoribosyltransferase